MNVSRSTPSFRSAGKKARACAGRFVRVRLTFSKLGVQVEAERAIATGTVVNVFSANFSPIGRASVRHCTQKGMGYRLGLYMPDRFVDDL